MRLFLSCLELVGPLEEPTLEVWVAIYLVLAKCTSFHHLPVLPCFTHGDEVYSNSLLTAYAVSLSRFRNAALIHTFSLRASSTPRVCLFLFRLLLRPLRDGPRNIGLNATVRTPSSVELHAEASCPTRSLGMCSHWCKKKIGDLRRVCGVHRPKIDGECAILNPW